MRFDVFLQLTIDYYYTYAIGVYFFLSFKVCLIRVVGVSSSK